MSFERLNQDNTTKQQLTRWQDVDDNNWTDTDVTDNGNAETQQKRKPACFYEIVLYQLLKP